MSFFPHRWRVPFLLLAVLALLAALWAGLIRIGWALPALAPGLAILHGPLMVVGFLGTLISLERAVALEQRWTYLAPVCHGLGALLALVLPGPVGPGLVVAGAALLVVIFAVIMRRQPALFTAIMLVGALVWLFGNILWLLGRPLAAVVPWWIGFLVLTIAGERLELGRLRHVPQHANQLFVAIVALQCLGLLVSLWSLHAGVRLIGGALVALALWLFHYDIARRTVRREGVTRYMALCMLGGYIWLAVSGTFALGFGGVSAGLRYDALLHSLFVGFVFAMIFGHAPVIFPAVLGIPVAFHRMMYLPLIGLHLSLLMRIIGDLFAWGDLRRWGGLLNALAMLAFFATIAWTIRRAKRGTACIPKPATSSVPH